ncbi:hypothetical protein EC973_004807 [Apophysomyces ossiformis]|uniref:Uncharacterized protein n=1 Tax=Apophysomyces ossiformis TaxID=679940 RepID=A0A8H7BKX7_9FUNG|nr:hypothetical protein EC973_004807 [Apophysomyces ossiformis]
MSAPTTSAQTPDNVPVEQENPTIIQIFQAETEDMVMSNADTLSEDIAAQEDDTLNEVLENIASATRGKLYTLVPKDLLAF